jgi:Fe-S-cluster containining protein
MNLEDSIKKDPDKDKPQTCSRCGTCCKKGGPAFHIEDRHLIQKGIILLKDLYTIRKGEPVYDNVKGGRIPAPSDIIKIKSGLTDTTCTHYDEKGSGCSIYEHRPMECRLLECWNTGEFEKQYASDRLTRKDLLPESNDLWLMVVDHDKRCDYSIIHQHLGPVGENTRSTVPPVVREMVRYDLHFRTLLAKKGGVDPAHMDFLFGTPLAETLKRYGIQTNVDYRVISRA